MTDREILLSLIAGLGLADNMGDVADDVAKAMELMGYEPPKNEDGESWGSLEELSTLMGNTGIKTLYGTSLADDDT